MALDVDRDERPAVLVGHGLQLLVLVQVSQVRDEDDRTGALAVWHGLVHPYADFLQDLLHPYVRVDAPAVFSVGHEHRAQRLLLFGVLGEGVDLDAHGGQGFLEVGLQRVGELQRDDGITRLGHFEMVEDEVGEGVFTCPGEPTDWDEYVFHLEIRR